MNLGAPVSAPTPAHSTSLRALTAPPAAQGGLCTVTMETLACPAKAVRGRAGGREGEVRMLWRSALTWTDGGAGFTRSERATVRAGGEVHQGPLLLLFCLLSPDRVEWCCCILSGPHRCLIL